MLGPVLRVCVTWQGVRKLQLHMATLSLYHLEAQRHWLIRLGKPPKGPADPSLAVLIHGGPHSCASCTYSRDVLFLTTLGFVVLAVNYRGSAGFGQEELPSVHGPSRSLCSPLPAYKFRV